MNALASVVLQCVMSGGIFTSLCAAIAVPPLVWLGVSALTPLIEGMHDDHRWQAGSAACAAALPGVAFLALVAMGVAGAATAPCLQLTAGKVLYGLLLALVAIAIGRSATHAMRRQRELLAMLASAKPAQGRAARIAAQVGIALFEVPDKRETLVMVAHAPQPGAYVSTFSLDQFDDAELRAALFHERAHLERADHRVTPWLYFLTDLLPLPVDRLIAVYRCSREFCADAGALLHVERTDLASALLRVVRGAANDGTPCGAAFAERDVMYGRLEALLRPKTPSRPNAARRAAVVAGLLVIVAVVLALPAVAPDVFHCSLRFVA